MTNRIDFRFKNVQKEINFTSNQYTRKVLSRKTVTKQLYIS